MNNLSLKLYIKGSSEICKPAEENIKEICLNYNIQLTVTDLEDRFNPAGHDPVFVVPTLVITAPLPERYMICGLADRQNVLSCLGIAP